jgi:hypothetical protein
LANVKKIFSSETAGPNGAKLGRKHLCKILAILKMKTGRNFSMSGINLGHHNLPTYEMSLKSDIVEFVRYCGGHFENGDGRNFSMHMWVDYDVPNLFPTLKNF